MTSGSEFSHSAILARAFGMPMMVQTGIAVDELAGKQIKGSVEAGEEGGLGRVILEVL
ncbi:MULTISPECIES: PEP-utilizing enzyme [Enterocloster]|uniref:PEP-utilizing enzyme n=1 Tax=Enterocloster TaxID=2719313 RepID=UPI00241E6EA0|nr:MULTISPECIES: PEP-utilizing enzyme [Enterocloster]MDR3756663.1 PEP-utilizing enzyme [Enterocloster sp.]